MPDADDLRERIESLRRLRDAASQLPWVLFGGPGKWRIGGPFPESGDESGGWEALQYAVAAANLAPVLTDAYDAATAETQRVAGLYRELAAAICGPTVQCEDHRILLLEAAKHRGEWQSLYVVAKDATIAERDAEIRRLRAALLTLANWQMERRPGGSGEMCDFADNTLKGASRDE